jgi:hypothetical protein
MVSDYIWYEYTNFTNFEIININSNNLSVSKIQSDNLPYYIDKIQISIDKFNSQIDWSGMWDLNEAQERLSNQNILYLFLKDNLPLGHVWYKDGFLFNAFVSNERLNGESQWFIEQTMQDRNNSGYETITLYTESWNHRANSFWKKLKYNIINKSE